jgi:hypothetical protein
MWFNPFMKWLIASPIHFLVSNNTMLITYKGWKSGKKFTTPVNYLKDGDVLYTTSLKERVWWRSLREGRSVKLLVQGKTNNAIPQVNESPEEVMNQLSKYFTLAPNLTRYYKVALDDNDVPKQEDLARIARNMIVVKFRITN